MQEKTVDFVTETSFHPQTSGEAYTVANSLTTYQVVLESVSVGEASIKTKTIDVPYRDGQIDITNFFGDVRFGNRQITMNFIIPWYLSDQRNIYSTMATALSGVVKKVVFASDPNWYYKGRLSVGSLAINDGMFKFPVTLDAHPYKMQDTKQTVTAPATNSSISNDGRMLSTLSLKANSTYTTTSITFKNSGNETVTLSGAKIFAAASAYPELIVTPGNNYLTIAGGGSHTVTIYYTKGKL